MVHGHDIISIRMLKLFGVSILTRLEIIFKSCFQEGQTPDEWKKKANVIPVHKSVKMLPPTYFVTSFEPLIYNKEAQIKGR